MLSRDIGPRKVDIFAGHAITRRVIVCSRLRGATKESLETYKKWQRQNISETSAWRSFSAIIFVSCLRALQNTVLELQYRVWIELSLTYCEICQMHGFSTRINIWISVTLSNQAQSNHYQLYVSRDNINTGMHSSRGLLTNKGDMW